MTERILLVGATGFLGSAVAARLAPRGAIALVRPTSDRSVLPESMPVRVGDLDQPLPLEDIDTLVYCASMGFGQVPGLVRQLENEKRVRRAVFVSTTAIFTSLPSASRGMRLEAEAAVQASVVDWTILRPTMIYGTARDRNVSRLLRFVNRWPVFPLCANALWQPVYVEDLADAVLASLESSAAIRAVYNLPGAAALPLSELVRTAARAIGRHIMLLPLPMTAAVAAARLTRIVTPEQIRRLAEDKAFSFADAARDLSFSPRSFAEGVKLEAASLGLGRRPQGR